MIVPIEIVGLITCSATNVRATLLTYMKQLGGVSDLVTALGKPY